MTFEQITKEIEAAGFSWAVEGHPEGGYLAVVGAGERIADTLADGLMCSTGSTPAEALALAFAETKKSSG